MTSLLTGLGQGLIVAEPAMDRQRPWHCPHGTFDPVAPESGRPALTPGT